MANVNSIKRCYGKTSRNLSAKLLLIWDETLYFFFFEQKTEMLEHHMFTHPLHKDSSLESLYGHYEQKAKV